MKAVILAGGRGTRMGQLSNDCPKPLITVGGQPVLFHQLQLLAQYKIQEVTLLTGYLGEQIQTACGDGSRWNLKISYIQEESPQGTAGALRPLREQMHAPFLLFSGDIMLNFDLDRLISFHMAKPDASVTVVVHPNAHMFDSDLVELNAQERVTALHLRPHPSNRWFHNQSIASAYLFSPEVLDFIPKQKSDIEKGLFPVLMENAKAIYGYSTPEYLKDMGTPERLDRVERDYLSGRIAAMNLAKRKRAVFLDRDGVLNHYIPDLNQIDDFQMYAFTAKAVKMLNHAGFLVIVITNQPMVAKGFLSETELINIHRKLETELGRDGAIIDALYYCPHHPEKGFPGEKPELKIPCECRKPNIGMIQKAQTRFNINLDESYMIGDSVTDYRTAQNAGLQFLGVATGLGCQDQPLTQKQNLHLFHDLLEAVECIIAQQD